MQVKRPTSFDEIKGHKELIKYFIQQIKDDTVPQFIILYGEEGLGKTSLADLLAINIVYGLDDSPEKQKAIKDVILDDKTTSNIKKYKMSVEGGKAAAKEVLQEFNTSLTRGNKVIICDECHQFSSDAKDVLLTATDTGRIPKGLYIIMMTTEMNVLKPQLRSRAVPMHLNRLKNSEMLALLEEEVERRQLNIQGGKATLNLITTWSECKPRAALSLLSAFSNGASISASLIKELIGYLEIDDVLPLVTSLAGSMTWGLNYISELNLTSSFVDVVVEILKIKLGQPSYKLRIDEAHKVKQEMLNVPEECVTKFTYLICGANPLTRPAVVSAFIQSHVSFDRVMTNDHSTLQEEKTQKDLIAPPPVEAATRQPAPSIEDLLANSRIME